MSLTDKNNRITIYLIPTAMEYFLKFYINRGIKIAGIMSLRGRARERGDNVLGLTFLNFEPLFCKQLSHDREIKVTYFFVLEKQEAATRGVQCKKVFLEISQNSQENTCVIVFFFKD